MNGLLWICFALSGGGALALELLWVRSAKLVLGATAETAATVVAAYLAGLSFGGYLARRAPTAPVRRYARLEFLAAVGAIGSYGVFRLLSSDGAQRALAWGGLGVRVAVVGLAVLPVTLALGATLPTLGQALATPADVGRRGGALYALNTFGGACGIALMGFGVPAAIGVRMSYLAAALANGAAGLLALWVGDAAPGAAPVAEAGSTAPPRRLWFVAAGTGFVGIGLELLWTVLFAQVLHNSVYSFAAVSLVFLLALAAGAAVSARLLRSFTPTRVAAIGLSLAGIGSVLGVWIFVRWTVGLEYFGMRSGLIEYLTRIVGLAAVTAGPGTAAAGAVLPALWAAFGDRQSVARPVGELTAVNLAGGVFGALAAAFVVLPSIGLRSGFLVAAVVYLVLAEAVRGSDLLPRPLACAGLLTVVLLDPIRAPLAHLNTGETLRATAEGAAGVVTVVDTGDDLQLRLDNYYVLGGSAAEVNERRQGLVPLLLHPAPLRVAFIGMATGISASAAAALDVTETTVVEIVPEVAALARTHFAPWNGRLLTRPGVRLVVDDGRRYLAATRILFDVVVSDLFIPWHASTGSLYSLEMYETVARRLAPGGLFCQWLPLYQLTREEFEVIARTFLAAFPHVSLWRNDFYPDRPVVGLVGVRQAIPLDLDRVGQRLSRLPGWSRDSLLGAPRALAMLYLGDLSLAPGVVARGPLNRDDRPTIEFLAPRLTRMSASGDKDWFTGEALALFADTLATRLDGRREPTLPATEDVREARHAGAILFRYAIAARRGDGVEAARLAREVRQLVPDVVAGAEPAAPVAGLADVRRALGRLGSEQARLRQELESLEERLRARSGASDYKP